MITAAWDILQDTNLRESPWDGCVVPIWDIWNVEMASSLQRVEKKSKWFSCVTQWERRSVELDVPVVEHKVNMWIPIELGALSWDRDEDYVSASSEQRVEMMKSIWLSCVMQWERRSVEWMFMWTSTGEHDPSGWALVRVVLLCNALS